MCKAFHGHRLGMSRHVHVNVKESSFTGIEHCKTTLVVIL